MSRLTNAERRARLTIQSREYRARNRETVRERARVRDRRARHGLTVHEWIAETLAAQHGECYLCGEPLGQRLVIDHDHSCCPAGSSCPACRRGLTCDRCNRLIGQVDDDPALLRRIADALDAVLEPTRARIAAKPAQLDLLANEESLWSRSVTRAKRQQGKAVCQNCPRRRTQRGEARSARTA